MKKIVFEGIVNDLKFDNVNDYNEAVRKVMDSGKPFSASSSTKAVCVDDNLLMTPGFNPIDKQAKYLDDTENKTKEDVKKDLDNQMTAIKNNISGYTNAELDAYFDSIDEILGVLDQKRDSIIKDFSRINGLLEKTNLFNDFYENLRSFVVDAKGIDDHGVNKDDKEEKEKEKEKEKEDEDNKEDACDEEEKLQKFNSLWDFIFG